MPSKSDAISASSNWNASVRRRPKVQERRAKIACSSNWSLDDQPQTAGRAGTATEERRNRPEGLKSRDFYSVEWRGNTENWDVGEQGRER